jgi:hypothetical protein
VELSEPARWKTAELKRNRERTNINRRDKTGTSEVYKAISDKRDQQDRTN